MVFRKPVLKKLRLGHLLVERGLLTEAQLSEALTEAQQSGQALGAVLVARGLLNEREVLGTLQRQSRKRTTATVVSVLLAPVQPFRALASGAHRSQPAAQSSVAAESDPAVLANAAPGDDSLIAGQAAAPASEAQGQSAGAEEFSITSQPASVIGHAGMWAEFSVETTQATAAFQWFKDGEALTSANGPQLVIPAVSAADIGNYWVEVRCGSRRLVSNPVVLKIPGETEPAPRSPQLFAPEAKSSATLRIVHSGEAMERRSGQWAVFDVEAEGEGSLSYQWFKDGRLIDGATRARLALPDVTPQDAGAYTVQIKDDNGSVLSSAIQLSVDGQTDTGGIRLLRFPDPELRVHSGQWTVLQCEAEAPGEVHFQWYRDQQPIAGADTGRYTIEEVSLSDAGVYTALVSSFGSSLMTPESRLIVSDEGPRYDTGADFSRSA